MALFSVKFQRGTVYLLCLLCVFLIYQIYNHGGQVVRSKKRSIKYKELSREDAENERKSKSVEVTTRRSKPSSHKDDNTSRLRESLLKKEIKALQSKLQGKDSTIRLLNAEIKEQKAYGNKLSEEVAQVKAQNAELLAEIETHNYSNSRSERIDSEESKEGSSKNNKRNLSQRTASFKMSEKVPFHSFAKTHVFEADNLPKPKEYIYKGQKKYNRIVKPLWSHIIEMQDLALGVINSNKSLHLTRENVVEGVFRFDMNYGVDYDIYFRDSTHRNEIISARVSRTLSIPIIELQSSHHKQRNELINLILPLSGRIERFQQFIELFTEVCIKGDKNVYLTVVLYGEKDFKAVKGILQDLEATYNFRKYQLIMRDKQFSRGKALHDGVIYWKGKNPNVLMFFCDVDITFRAEFLRRCRTYTEPGKQVYYPMVFSLYNPKNVYQDGNIPNPQEQLKIERSHGFWRTYGFGMTCQYRSDYLRVGGFDLSIEGWGSEDQQLYAMYTARPEVRNLYASILDGTEQIPRTVYKLPAPLPFPIVIITKRLGITRLLFDDMHMTFSKLKPRIIRAPDRDLFHHYHEKYCDPNLKWEQYRSCLGSKAKVEGTPAQIAMQLTKLREKFEADS